MITESMVKYIHLIGLSTEIAKRVEKIAYEYKLLIPTLEIEDIFICDYIKEDGSRDYESLWLLSKNYVLEAKNSLIRTILIFPYYEKSQLLESEEGKL